MPKKLFVIFCCVFYIILSTTVSAQSIISGKICDSRDDNPIDYANIIITNSKDSTIIAYSISDENGSFSISIKDNDADSLAVKVTALNIKPSTRFIANISQRLDLYVDYETFVLNDVIIKGDINPISKRGDTLTYVVAEYKDENDRVIEDVLKKMPGIDIDPSGTIKYQGKAINRFYIEGLDMLGDKYSIASRTIVANDVASVKVYENHQSVKALRNVTMLDEAAIDIKLNESAKATWISTVQIGVGYKPILWDVGVNASFFGKKSQFLALYNTNNTGVDYNQDTDQQYIGVRFPTEPPLEKNLYIDNKSHHASVNTIKKIKEDIHFRTNVEYSHDDISSKGESTYLYSLDTNIVRVHELINAGRKIDKLNIDFNVEANESKFYFSNTIEGTVKQISDNGTVDTEHEIINQEYCLKSGDIVDKINLIIPFGRYMSLGANSLLDLSRMPTQLFVFNPESISSTQTLNVDKLNNQNQRKRPINCIFF